MALQIALTILAVDDEPSFTSEVAALLRHDGHTVNTVGNGALALAQLQERRYDVVLCDLQRPDLDGPAFYAILKSQYASLCQRVIFLTGDSMRVESLAFLEQCGSRGFLSLAILRPSAALLSRCYPQQRLSLGRG